MPAPSPPEPTASLRVLVVDDEASLRHMLTLMLERAGYRVVAVANGREALEHLSGTDVVLCDIRMPEMDGLGFLRALPKDAPPVVMMSAYGTLDTALTALRMGAYDYISKPFRSDEIVLTLRKLEEREQLLADRAVLIAENQRLAERVGEPVNGFVGRSAAAREAMRILARVAPHESTVLFTGESGTGKELLARALHRLSPRQARPWVAVNCAAIPESLLEAELFGYSRGAFTGAVQSHPGLFAQADGGTLFLDEIGDLPLPLQSKLLRVLEEGAVRPLGARGEQRVDCRIVAASARSLSAPEFRPDLYYRLAVVHIRLPPLRERTEDIPLLIEHFLDALSQRLGLPRPTLTEEARRLLLGHAWPGNVRQLEHALERAMLVGSGGILSLDDLPPELRAGEAAGEAGGGGSLSIPRGVAQLERELIARALRESGGNKAAASRVLEISYKALHYKIRAYGLGEA